MRKLRLGAALIVGATLTSCTTTEQASQAVQSRWLGQSADEFFTKNGPPASSYTLANGNVIYTWRGGETTRHVPARYAAPQMQPPPLPSFGSNSNFGKPAFGMPQTATTQPVWGRQVVRTETKVENPQPGVTRTTTVTKSSGASIGWNLPTSPASQGQLLSPARTEQLSCELQLTADQQNIIRSIRISKDTAGAGFSLSRCAEVMGVT
ncbi:hypothetical protein [Affinirhizobium pseudoryzae]|uniref:hypothetical protein n=1 Tax=Allorhizobium pseudoryzae TaxID=379684 RepID=UPI0013EB59B2|nr:hypothetical protein [Allorhizobium pseudoryzae]